MDEPGSARNKMDSGEGFWLAREANGSPEQVVTGTRVFMTTTDPDKLPFPDCGLLRMQVFMQKILAMSGAAGWADEDDIKSDGDERAKRLFVDFASDDDISDDDIRESIEV